MGAQDRKADDHRLIEQAKKGNQKAFETLMHRYRNLVYHVMLKMIRNPQDAEDLTQEAFMKAFHALNSFNEEYAFSTWLMKIATNNCIDLLRKRKLKAISIDQPVQVKDDAIRIELPDRDPTPERRLLSREQSRLIDQAIDSLPPLYRHVIVLRHREEKSYEEIAEILDLPLGTVKARIFRAREMLNKKIKELFNA
ncbi:MAG: sigma-70 family RNA polymerase sigma factor [Calditrichaeota bacterium]|nr:MAG: sigma-70 family RNA polymerase sigma factor [Calditrichota bacterium]